MRKQKTLDEYVEELIDRYVCDGLWDELDEQEKEIIIYEIELTLKEIQKSRKFRGR